MPDGQLLGYQSLLAAAESAAADGDLRRTEALFREAVQAQEEALGPAHPGLASTCNNLAVVCERMGRLEDAEYYYRRAYAIAVSLLHSKDPQVQTSFSNLKEFCQEHGLPLDDWPEIATRASHVPLLRPRPAAPVTVPHPRPVARPSRVRHAARAAEPGAPDADVADLFGVYAAPQPPAATSIPVQPVPRTAPILGPPIAPAATPPSTPAVRSPELVAFPPLRTPGLVPIALTRALTRRPASRRFVAAVLVTAVIAATAAVALRGRPSETQATPRTNPATPPASNASETEPVGRSANRAPAAVPAAIAAIAAPPASAPSATPKDSRVTPTAAPATPPKAAVPPAAASPADAPTAATTSRPAESRNTRTTDASPSAAQLRVVTTGVCTTLETRAQPWRCVAVGDGVAQGPVTYYTRIANSQATTRVEHRWYQDDALRLTRSLSLAYSPTEGYRTYSRHRPAPGRWRVELVGPDGTVLHEARFDVR